LAGTVKLKAVSSVAAWSAMAFATAGASFTFVTLTVKLRSKNAPPASVVLTVTLRVAPAS